MTRTGLLRCVKKTALVAAAFLLALGLGLAGLLGTTDGRQALLDLAAGATASENFHLSAHGLTLGREWRLNSLQLGDAKGIWLDLEHIRLRPRIGALFSGRLFLEHLGIARTMLLRLPDPEAASRDTAISLPPVRIMSASLDRIELRREALGQPATLSAYAELELDRDGGRAELSIIRLDRPQDMLRMTASLRQEPEMANLELHAHEAPQGLLHTLLDLDRLPGENSICGISLTLRGQGNRTLCPLTISLRLADVLSLDADTALTLTGNPKMLLRGRVRLGAAAREAVRLVDPEIKFTAHASWAEKALRLSGLHVENAAGTLAGNATWNPAGGELLAAMRAVAGDISPLLPADIAPGQAVLDGTLRSAEHGLYLNADFNAADWTISGYRLRSAGLNASLARAGGSKWNFRTAFAVRVPDLPPDLQTISGNATGRGQDQSWFLDNLEAETRAVSMRAHAKAGSAVDGNASVVVRNLALGGYALSGRVNALAAGSLEPDRGAFRARLTLSADGISGLPPELLHLMGKTPELRASVSFAPDMLQVDGLDLRGNTRLTGNATFRPNTRAFSGAFNAVLPELHATNLHLPAGPSVRGRGHGNSTDLHFSLEAQAPVISVGQMRLDNATASVSIAGLHRPACTLHALARAAGEPAKAAAHAVVGQETIQLENATLTLPHNRLTLNGRLHPAYGIFQGQGRFDSASLAPLGRLAGQEMGGTFSLQGDFFAEKNRQALRVRGCGNALSIAGTRIANATLSGSLTLPDPPQLDMVLTGIARGGMRLDSLRLQTRGHDGETEIAFGLHQNATRSTVTGKGRASLDASRIRAALTSLNGTLLGQKLRLDAPVSITHEPERTAWTRGVLRFGSTALSASGAITPAAMNIAARLENMNPALLRPLWPGLPQGSIEAALNVGGSPERPDARLDVRGSGIQLTDPAWNRLEAVDISGNATLKSGRVESMLILGGQRGALAAAARISLPVRGIMPSISIAEDAPVTGRMQGSAQLALLTPIMMPDGQTISGKADLDILLGGTASAPALNGMLRVRDGRYENYRTGTRLESISAVAAARGSEADFILNATDGRQGSLSAQGSADLRQFSYTCDILLSEYELVHTDQVRGSAGGSLLIGGRGGAASVNGTLIPNPVYVYLTSGMSGVTRVDVEETNVPAENGASPAQENAGLPVHLHVRLDIPARLFVQGRGLDSEWSGRLDISGPQSDPEARGHMHLLRGRFEFLDRIFDLTKGAITLSGETPPNPFLDIVGECRISDTLIQARINGPARDFRLALSSTPSLPQDELLSMIIFGRSLREISPLQAVRLAQAAAELTGTGVTGLDFLDSVKSSLGLQEVDIGKDDEGNTAIEIGGYVDGKYYVRTQSSISGQDRTKIEIRLTPEISVETEIGADSRQGGGINWRKDY